MKDYNDLINNINNYYFDLRKETYKEIQIHEIREYLIKRRFPIAALQNLYDLLTEAYSELPDKSKFRITIDRAFENKKIEKSKERTLPDYIYKQIPQYQLESTKNWPVAKILDHVNFLRKKQSQLWKDDLITNDMPTDELSFLCVWDSLRYVKSDNLEIAKKRIIQLGPNIDLRDLEPEPEKIQIEPVRKQQTQSMQDIIRDIPI